MVSDKCDIFVERVVLLLDNRANKQEFYNKVTISDRIYSHIDRSQLRFEINNKISIYFGETPLKFKFNIFNPIICQKTSMLEKPYWPFIISFTQ